MNHKFTRIDLEEQTVSCSACGYKYRMGDAGETLKAAQTSCPGKQDNVIVLGQATREVVLK